ncbi:hypothetical protein [Streptacidiphilus albus]|uniref:hypothetical protein n=1 Tax=Streptacidiphilus albus TaxID=105425 RepID=UPI00054C159D|nr:hypothetical protein [Streptacidiphilus albus]
MIATTQDSPSITAGYDAILPPKVHPASSEPEFVEVARIETVLAGGSSVTVEQNEWREETSPETGRHWPASTEIVLTFGDMQELKPKAAVVVAEELLDLGVTLAAFAQRAETGWNPAGPAPALDVEAAGVAAVRQIARRVCEDAAKGDEFPLPAVRVGTVGNQLLDAVIGATSDVTAAYSKASPASAVYFSAAMHSMAESFKHVATEARAAGEDETAAVKRLQVAFTTLVEITAEYALNPDEDG